VDEPASRGLFRAGLAIAWSSIETSLLDRQLEPAWEAAFTAK
jgi:hypothetical protein